MAQVYFENRILVIATMHGKEQVIAPLLEKELGVRCVLADKINTDALGTFSGEVERKSDPISTAKAKCLLAMKQTGADLAVASEGSFGAHPAIFFAKANEELVVLLDAKNSLEIVGRVLTTETNFDGKAIQNWSELKTFANDVLFPAHALIMRVEQNDVQELVKGINTWDDLEENYNHFFNQYGKVWVETDMRAMHNPTRMQAIIQATEKLIENVKSLCPICETPGFSATSTKTGLPCSLCGSPTKSVVSVEYSCSFCDFHEHRPRTDGKTEEDPMYCDSCNP
jgi:hypothetical protein